MISSTTLILATLVFNAASILGAPIRIPDAAPDVVKRAPAGHAQPTLPTIPKVPVVDVQPVHKRSVNGMANRPRLAREVVPEHDIRDTASESVEIRDSPIPEVERIVRRFPRRHLAEFYERRSPEPAPAPSAPSPQTQPRSEPAPPVERRFFRRSLFDRHAQRSADPEPAPPLEARNEHDPDGHFVRDHNPELMAKRDALPTDNVPREPEPAPAPEPAPNPAPSTNSEKVRSFPRRVYAEYYAKRQDDENKPKPEETTTATPTSTSTSSASSTTATATSSPSAAGLPASLEKAIADALVKGSSNPAANPIVPGKKSSYSDTTITIKITHSANSDMTTPEKPNGSTNNPPPTVPSSSPTATSTPTATGTATSTPTGTGTPKPPTTGSATGSTSSGEEKPEETKPKGESEKPAETPAEGGSSSSPDGGNGAPNPDAEPRDLGDSNAADQPLTKRKLGLSGALWASWSRRNIQKD